MLNFKVSEILSYLKEITNKDYVLANLAVEGEISNLNLHSSGNAYFSIKDEFSKLSCIMYDYKANEKIIKCKDGEKVSVVGRITISEFDGEVRLIADDIENIGIGKLYENFLKIKSELEILGYFDDKHKKQIPEFAKKIGVVTSPDGAAIRDILSIAKRRNPYVNFIIYPAKVQGSNSAQSLIKGLDYFENSDVELVIIGRGGGSYEDLDSFNSRDLAIKIFDFNKPIISAVGHEIDFVISDFVSDLRAPTPSAAAELSIYDINKKKYEIQNSIKNLFDRYDRIIATNKEKLSSYKKRIDLLSIDRQIDFKSDKLKELINHAKVIINHKIELNENRLETINELLNPDKIYSTIEKNEAQLKNLVQKSFRQIDYKILKQEKELLYIKNRLEKLDIKSMLRRGYSIALDNNDNVVKDIATINIGDNINVLIDNGIIEAKITAKKEY